MQPDHADPARIARLSNKQYRQLSLYGFQASNAARCYSQPAQYKELSKNLDVFSKYFPLQGTDIQRRKTKKATRPSAKSPHPIRST